MPNDGLSRNTSDSSNASLYSSISRAEVEFENMFFDPDVKMIESGDDSDDEPEINTPINSPCYPEENRKMFGMNTTTGINNNETREMTEFLKILQSKFLERFQKSNML
jgi:hypothetical protein